MRHTTPFPAHPHSPPKQRRWMITAGSAVVLSALVAGCSDQPAGPGAELQDSPLFGSAAAAISQPVDHIEDFGAVPGAAIHAATLRRNGNNAMVTLRASVPAPNTATMWAAIFSAPENCQTAPCGIDDLLNNPDAKPSLLRAGGRVIGGGLVVMTGHVREGDASEALFGNGLMDAMTDEIHFVLRVHGPQIPMMVDDQILSFGGGCDVNPCADTGAAIFQPPQ